MITTPNAIAIAAATAGTLLAARSAVRWLRRDKAWFEDKETADGVVTRLDDIGDGDYKATIEYRAADAKTYQLTANNVALPGQIGKQLAVAYDRTEPSKARLLQENDPPGVFGTAIVFGFIFAAIYFATFPLADIAMHFWRR